MKHSAFSRVLVLGAAVACALVQQASAQTTLLDTFTGSTGQHITGGTPRTYMGHSFTNNTLPGGTTHFQITSLTVYLVSTAAVSYSDIVYRLQFWNTVTPAGATVYSNAAGPLLSLSMGPLTTAANTFYQFTITLPTPITLTGGAGTSWGFVQNWQGNSGSGLVDSNNLTSLITSNTSGSYAAGQNTTGTAPAYGWYRNASGRTDFNFVPSDQRVLNDANGNAFPTQGIAIQIRGTAIPEPSTYALLLIGAAGAIGAWKRRRK
jgi:hypothetical protein